MPQRNESGFQRARSSPRASVAIGAAALLITLAGCVHESDATAFPGECGTFDFDKVVEQPNGNPRPDLRFKVGFNFRPQMCSIQTCSCGTIAYLQMLRITDQSDENAGEALQVNDEQTDRMLRDPNNPWSNGWSLDRATGRDWPLYGENNDGSFDLIVNPGGVTRWDNLAAHVTLGSNTLEATMIDAITYAPRDTYRVDVVQAPVCIDQQSACANRVLGYNAFAYAVSPDPVSGQKIGEPQQHMPFPHLDLVLHNAVDNWNAQHDEHQIHVNTTP
jgi:hypothetical protein